jgi:hypothetical protein
MESRMTTNRTIVIAVATLVAVGLGYWGYGAHKARELNQAAVAALADTNARLREALGIETGPAPANRAPVVKKLDDHVAAVDQHLSQLRGLDAARNRALADAADYYLLSARELLKKQADSQRHRLLLADSAQALREHMRADNHTSAWVQQAVKAKERVNKDYRGYSLATEVLGTMLETFSAAQKRIVPYIEASALIADDLIAGARTRVAEDAVRMAAEMEKMQRLGASR